jgi:hypothetical protein
MVSCCGKKRESLTLRPSQELRPPTLTARSQPQAAAGLVVEYVGSTSLHIRGPVSGQMYRFVSSGTRVVVDGRDAPFILAIPHLRKRVQGS